MDKLMKCCCTFVFVSTILFISKVCADKGACVRNPGPIAQLCSRSNVTGSTVSVDASLFKDSGRTRCTCRLNVSSPEVLVVTTSSPGFMECGTSLELAIGEDRKDFGCAMATHTSTRGEGSISILNSTRKILASDYCVLFQVREGEVSLVCEDQEPNLDMATTNMATTDTEFAASSTSTESGLSPLASTNANIPSSSTETNTNMTTTASSQTDDTSSLNQTFVSTIKSGILNNSGNATTPSASELKRLFANTQISEDKMSGFLNKYPDLHELVIEPVTPGQLVDNSTKGLFAEFAKESFTDMSGRLQPEVTSLPVLPTEKQPISTVPPTEKTTILPTTTIILDQPVADKNAILDKYPDVNETVFEPVPEGLLDLIKPIEDAILPKTTSTPVGESISTEKAVDPTISSIISSSPVTTTASVDVVSTQVSSTNVSVVNSSEDSFVSESSNVSSSSHMELSTSDPGMVDQTTTEQVVNKSIILEKHPNVSDVIIEPIPQNNFTSFQNESKSDLNTTSTTISGISVANFTSDVPIVNKSAILEKHSGLSNVTFEPVSHESSTLFSNDSTMETTDIPIFNKTTILEKHSDFSNVTFEPVSVDSSTLFLNESMTENTDFPTVNKSAILEKTSNVSDVIIEPVTEETFLLLKNQTTSDASTSTVTRASVIPEVNDTVSTTDSPVVDKSTILEKHANLSDVIIEPATEDTLELLQNGTTSLPDLETGTGESSVWRNNISDIMADMPIVNKSSILEKYSNLSDITIEPATYENFTFPERDQSTAELNTEQVITDSTTPLLPASGLPYNQTTDKSDLIYPVDNTTQSVIEKNISSTLNLENDKHTNASQTFDTSSHAQNESVSEFILDTTAVNVLDEMTTASTVSKSPVVMDKSALTENRSTIVDSLNQTETQTGFTSGNVEPGQSTSVDTGIPLSSTIQPSISTVSGEETTTSSIKQDRSTGKITSSLPPMESLVEISTQKQSTQTESSSESRKGKLRGDIPISDIPQVTDSQFPTEAPVKLVTHMSSKSAEIISQFSTEAPVKLVTHMSPKSTEGTSQFPTEAPVKLVTHMSPKSTEGIGQFPTEAPVKLVTHMIPKSTEGTSQFPTEAPVKLFTDMIPKSTEGTSQFPTEAPVKLFTHISPKSTEGISQFPTEAPVKIVTDKASSNERTTSTIISTLRTVDDPITTGTGGIGKSTQDIMSSDVITSAVKTTAIGTKTSTASNVSITDNKQNATDESGFRTTKSLSESTDAPSRNKTRGSINATKTGDDEDSFYLNNHTLTIIIIGSVIGVLVIIAIIVIIASFMKSRRRSANITGFEKDGMELNGGGIDNPLVQLEQERQLVETNPNPALNGSMDFTIIPSSSGVKETSQTTHQNSETNNVTHSS